MESQRLRRSSLPPVVPHDYGFSYVKLAFVVGLFLLSLVAFVAQTELTSLVYTQYAFHEPVLLLYLTHASWWMLWPMQVLAVGVFKAFRRPKDSFRRGIASSIKAQHRMVFHCAELTAQESLPGYTLLYPDPKASFKHYSTFIASDAFKYMLKTALVLSVVLNCAGVTWYVAMGLSTGGDVTAIYNCSAFTAYVFGVFLLGDTFSIMKAMAVVVAVAGVFMVAYLGSSDGVAGVEYPHRLLGNLVILFGAILYGLYEVLYKKMACPPANEVSARRQAGFSNFVMCLIGLATAALLTPIILFVHITGLHHFDIPSDWGCLSMIALSVLANQVFSLAFLGLMSLTSPVFSSVASLLTILVVGWVEWMFRGVLLTLGQLGGYLCIVMGFSLLTFCSWGEISEEERDDGDDFETDSESIMNDDTQLY